AAAVTRLAAARGLDVLVTSAPLASAALEQALRRDLLVVAAAAAVAVIIALLLLLRRGYAVLAVLVSLLVSAALFCALLVLCGLSLDLYAALLAPLLIGYGVDDHIYIARETLRDGAAAAYARSGRAVITTTATSVGAIGALWICETEGLRRLALSASIGLTVTMLCALLVLPALLAVGGRSRH
ncbi:MAG: MMPL family transporter, partial [Myxococcales bacterium]|nr:MMPL family transporter [Myxococcales bacterium]